MTEVINNELLCFVFNKLSLQLTPTISLLCINTYDEKTIEDAKTLLLHHCEINGVLGKFRCVKRTGQDKKAKNMEDIMKMAHLLGDKGPCFVAADLSKLPPISIDNIDVCNLLTKIESMETDLKYTKDLCSKMAQKFEQHMNSCKKDIHEEVVGASSTNPNSSKCITAGTHTATNSGLPASTLPQANGAQNETSNLSSRHPNTTSGQQPAMLTAPQSGGNTYARVVERNSNSVVTGATNQKKQRTRNPPKKGTLETTNLKTSVREISVFTKFWGIDEKENEVEKFIKDVHKLDAKCEQVLTRAKHYKCFKVVIRSNDSSFIFNTDFWPKEVEFRRFHDRASNNNNKAISKGSVGKFNYNGNQGGYKKNLLDYGFKSTK